ncbi:MAG: C4-type zinc ribbon domain-containing protein [Sphaerochaetaceae bacterium]|nr:C4-type zinc ribbon domain-containing protein [Spirochaetales bacterium]MDY3768045.1 C4-type zinc ribbon domain-containing protein [Sphaerochaetaceae bacterium]MDY5967621.1 C4-type zinc ribbon domain-containing protein [Sphaerochaetaceae bacterium]
MKDILKKLSMLQKVLQEYYELEKEIESIPKDLSDRDEMLSRKREQYAKAIEKEQDLKKKVVEFEEAYNNAKIKRAELEAKSAGITSQREFETHQIELSKAKETEHNFYNLKEDTKRRVVQEAENVADIQMTLNELQKNVDEDKKNISSRLDELIKERDALKQKKDKYSKDIDPTLLFKFERIVKTKGGGSVAVKGRVCQGCHMELPVQFVNTIKKGEEVMFCPYCSRVLYYQEGDDSDIDVLHDDNILLDEEDENDIIDDDMDIMMSDDDDNDVIASEDEFDF